MIKFLTYKRSNTRKMIITNILCLFKKSNIFKFYKLSSTEIFNIKISSYIYTCNKKKFTYLISYTSAVTTYIICEYMFNWFLTR